MTPDLTAPRPHISGALYFVEMQQDGGVSEYSTNEASNCREPYPVHLRRSERSSPLHRYSTNEAGAKYGTGYCDAQCPHDIKWIAGKANQEDWNRRSRQARLPPRSLTPARSCSSAPIPSSTGEPGGLEPVADRPERGPRQVRHAGCPPPT